MHLASNQASATQTGRRLVIVHYHYRPGGIRRIIEHATPHLLRHSGLKIQEVVLVGGEAPEPDWLHSFKKATAPAAVQTFIHPAFGYYSEQTKGHPIEATRHALASILIRDQTLVWAHNLGIARNLLLTTALTEGCAAQAIPLVLHHHDWWFDNRWARWPELRQCGIRTLKGAAAAFFPDHPHVHHVSINHEDAEILRDHLPGHSSWIPNLTEHPPVPSRRQTSAAALWLDKKLNAGGAPVWLIPCRLLRRKNVAEALLLARWLRPEAWLVTTGGISSADEEAYGRSLTDAAVRNGWKLRLGILQKEARHPAIPELLAASEAVLLTSIQEGFGLPYIEAAASHRPLIARALPNITPDLERFGFRFSNRYDEILIHSRMFDLKKERERQRKLFHAWQQGLPAAARRETSPPDLIADSSPSPRVPFSQLTLTAQLEVLSVPPEISWKACLPINPLLEKWRRQAAAERLRPSAWPARADRWLGGSAYAERFARAVDQARASRKPEFDAETLQADFIRQKLGPDRLFPLLWARET